MSDPRHLLRSMILAEPNDCFLVNDLNPYTMTRNMMLLDAVHSIEGLEDKRARQDAAFYVLCLWFSPKLPPAQMVRLHAQLHKIVDTLPGDFHVAFPWLAAEPTASFAAGVKRIAGLWLGYVTQISVLQ
jgi:hypothetical protein